MMDQEFSKLDWQTLRRIAQKVWVSSVKAMLKDFKDPVRSDIPKGDPIGPNREKTKAALLMTLHPRGLKLADVARMVGTTHGTVRFWRCQEDFQDIEKEGRVAFGEHLSNTLEYIMEGKDVRPRFIFQGIPNLEKRPIDLIFLLPFFDTEIVSAMEKFIRTKIQSGKKQYSVLATGFLYCIYSHLDTVGDSQRLKAFRKWFRDPNVNSFTQIALNDLIDTLNDTPDEQVRRLCADTLRSIVFSFLRFL